MEATFAAASQLAEKQYELEETHADLEVSATVSDVVQERLGKITKVMVGAAQNLVKLHHENEAVLYHNIEAGRRAVDLCSHAMESNGTAAEHAHATAAPEGTCSSAQRGDHGISMPTL